MIKYITDEKGRRDELIIPVELWEKIKSINRMVPIHKMDKANLRQYIGKIGLSIDPSSYQQPMRNEWE